MTTKINPEKLPQHLAIMIDGNRRWAKNEVYLQKQVMKLALRW